MAERWFLKGQAASMTYFGHNPDRTPPRRGTDALDYLRQEAKGWVPYIKALQGGVEEGDVTFLNDEELDLNDALRLLREQNVPRGKIRKILEEVFYDHAQGTATPEDARDMAQTGLDFLTSAVGRTNRVRRAS